IAGSNKAPGEGIGNKGVGFRSVLQITEWPEVYSASECAQTSELFEGFCFRFADRDDVIDLVDGDELAARRVQENISPYFLPVPIERQDEAVRRFAREGFASVIRLPLKSASAQEEALRRFVEIEASDSPVLLFLDRICALTVELVAPDSTRCMELRRTAVAASGLADDQTHRYEMVDLGVQGRFLLASGLVKHDDLLTALRQSVDEGQLEGTWLDWQDEAWVSVAARLDRDIEIPRIYTFLPMKN